MTYTNSKIIINSDFDVITGYGNLAVELAIALERSGEFDVYAVGSVGFDLPRALTKLFEKPKPQKFDIYMKIGTPSQLALPSEMKTSFPFKKVALTMWEQTRLTNKLLAETYYNDYDAIFVPCEMNVGVFKEVYNKEIKVLPLGVDTEFFTPINRAFENPLRFCLLGNLTYRKNVMGAIKAAATLIEQGYDIELSLKTDHNYLPPELGSDRIHIHSTTMWTREMVRNFYQNNDVYLAISRGEGFNFPALEFAATGGVVLGHNWGGHEAWYNELYCANVLLYNRIKISPNIWADAAEGSEWAEVDSSSLVREMIRLYEDRKILIEKSRNAARFMGQMFSWDSQLKYIITLLKGV